jgi:UDP-N-acetylmuramoyl-tripeptide--D-alanyl-D-alanine ligase
MQWRNEDILKATGGRLVCGPATARFAGVGIDSRVIAADRLFAAICGERHDGHTFVPRVLAKGVQGVLVQEDHLQETLLEKVRASGAVCIAVTDTTRALGALAAFQRSCFAIPVVAITGSNGKTTTRRMAEQVLAQRFNTLATQGNLNNEIGLPLTLFNLGPAHQAAVLELGMNHFGEMDRLGAICRPTVGVITNVAAAHLEFLGSLEGVARAKGEIIPHIDAGGTLVLNQDDPHVAALSALARSRVLFFGTGVLAEVRAEDVRATADGVAFTLCLPDAKARVSLRTPGRFMVPNALAAAAAGHLVGLTVDQIRQGLEGFEGVKGRLDLIRSKQGVHIIDDTYNANPGSMQAAFDTLVMLKKDAPAYIVLGDMLELGDQSAELHARVGEQAALAGPLKLYAFGPHAGDVAAGALRGGLPPERMFTGTKEAIAADLLDCLKPGDWLLVKGSRGMAMETVVEAVSKVQQE